MTYNSDKRQQPADIPEAVPIFRITILEKVWLTPLPHHFPIPCRSWFLFNNSPIRVSPGRAGNSERDSEKSEKRTGESI